MPRNIAALKKWLSERYVAPHAVQTVLALCVAGGLVYALYLRWQIIAYMGVVVVILAACLPREKPQAAETSGSAWNRWRNYPRWGFLLLLLWVVATITLVVALHV